MIGTILAMAVDLIGMPPQIDALRRVAKESGWQVVCTGRSGEQQVIRVMPPASLSGGDEAVHRARFNALASQIIEPDGPHLHRAKCDHRPFGLTGDTQPPFGDPALEPAAHDLAFGPPEQLGPVLPIAVACGFSKATLRPLNQTDRDFIGRAEPPPIPQADWVVLDAGERPGTREGPILCYIKLALHRTEAQHANAVR